MDRIFNHILTLSLGCDPRQPGLRLSEWGFGGGRGWKSVAWLRALAGGRNKRGGELEDEGKYLDVAAARELTAQAQSIRNMSRERERERERGVIAFFGGEGER